MLQQSWDSQNISKTAEKTGWRTTAEIFQLNNAESRYESNRSFMGRCRKGNWEKKPKSKVDFDEIIQEVQTKISVELCAKPIDSGPPCYWAVLGAEA